MIDCCVVLYYTNKPYHLSSILFIIYKACTYADVYLTYVNSTHTASIDTDFEDEYVQLVASEMKPYTQYVLKIGDLIIISIF